MSIASQPDERADAIEVYLRHPGAGTLARAFTTPDGAATGALQRVTSGALRGGLTTWVHVGMTVRRLRGRSDPLQGLGHRDTFLALCRLAQAAVEGAPLPAAPEPGLQATAHVRMFTTPYPSDVALARLEQVLRPYAAAGTVTRTGRAVIGWFAIRHLIAVRSSAYSLQVVHLTPEGGGPCQVSLMLPRAAERDDGRRLGPRRLRRRAQRAAEAAQAAAAAAAAGAPAPAGDAEPLPLQAYLDSYREHLTRELLLEPVVASGSAASAGGLAWTPEPTGDGGVAVGGTVPAAVPDQVVLRMAAAALAQLGERAPERAGVPMGAPEPDGDLLVQRWAVGAARGHVLSVAARSGDRRRPTQVLIHLAPVEAAGRLESGRAPAPAGPARPDPEPAQAPVPPAPSRAFPEFTPVEFEAPHEIPRSGPAVDAARALLLLPLWWHSADARCDGNDVILYEMPFRGQRLRIRANDYPAEPMYTLLVGDAGAETAAVDLEDWPVPWTRPLAY